MNVIATIIFFLYWASVEGCKGIENVNFNSRGGGGDDDDVLPEIIRSIENGLESFYKDAEDLVIDSVFTLKVNRDQLVLALHKLENTSNPENLVLLRCLRELKEICEEIIEKAFRGTGTHSNIETLGNIIFANWSLNVEPRPVNLNLLQPRIEGGNIFLGKVSDYCLGKIVGIPRCQILPSCLEFNTQLGKSEYAITHQLLYFQTGLMFSCFNETPAISDLLTIFCSNIFVETQDLASLNFPNAKRDLFMEQIFLCSMSGFTDFLVDEWFKAIISWQDDQQGCWHSTRKANQPSQFLRRVKRSERRLPDGCLCHETAMALSAMVQYLKYRAYEASLEH